MKHNLDVTKLLLRHQGDVGATFRLWHCDDRVSRSENFPVIDEKEAEDDEDHPQPAMDSGDEEEPEVPDVQVHEDKPGRTRQMLEIFRRRRSP